MSSSVKHASESNYRNALSPLLTTLISSYEEALLDIGTVLHRYDDDDCYAVYGFGGVPHGLKHAASSVRSPSDNSPEEHDVSSEVVASDLPLNDIPVFTDMRSVSSMGLSNLHLDRMPLIVEGEEEKKEGEEEVKPSEEVRPEGEMPEVKPEEVTVEEKKEEEEKKPEEVTVEEKKEEEEKKPEEVTVEEKKEEEEKKPEEVTVEEKKPEEEKKLEEEEKKPEEEEKKPEVPQPTEEKPEDKPTARDDAPISPLTPIGESEEGEDSPQLSFTEKADMLFVSSFKEKLDKLKLDQSHIRPSARHNLESTLCTQEAFPLNGNPKSPQIQGTDAVISAYRKMLRSLMPSYPTYFQDILKLGIEWVRARSVTYRRAKEAEKCKGREYVVLFIVSDCCIVDQVETTQLIIDIS